MKKRKKTRKIKEKSNANSGINSVLNDFYPEASLDYHEFGMLDHFEIEKLLNDFLEDCYINKLHNVLVITGKGQVVRPLVGRLLKNHKLVKSFKTAGYFNGQNGAYEVSLID